MCARNQRVSTMTLLELWVISPESKSTSVESTVRRSGNARNAPRNMQFNLIGKLTPRFAVPESINVTAEPCFRGSCSSSCALFVLSLILFLSSVCF